MSEKVFFPDLQKSAALLLLSLEQATRVLPAKIEVATTVTALVNVRFIALTFHTDSRNCNSNYYFFNELYVTFQLFFSLKC